jgi:hypothetical protein
MSSESLSADICYSSNTLERGNDIMAEEVSIEQPHEFEEQLHRLDMLCDRYAKKPLSGDIYMGAFAKALKSERHSADLYPVVKVLYDVHPEIKPNHAFGHVLRSFQDKILRNEDKYPGYPRGFESPDGWAEVMHELLADPDIAGEIEYDMHARETQSNIAERYKTFKVLMHLYAERFGKSPHVLDIGCSQNLGLKKIALNKRFRYVSLSNTNNLRDALTETSFNRLSNRKVMLGESYGVDLSIHNPAANKDWIKSNSFYPQDFLNSDLIREYDELEEQKVPNLDIVLCDLLTDGVQGLRTRNGGPIRRKYDFVISSTMEYQLTEDERERMNEIRLDLLGPNGIDIHQEFGHKDPLNPARHIISDEWFWSNNPYHTTLRDTNDESLEFQTVFESTHGRVREIKLGEGLLSLAGTQLTVAEALQKKTNIWAVFR